jgi:hypothetical protein
MSARVVPVNPKLPMSVTRAVAGSIRIKCPEAVCPELVVEPYRTFVSGWKASPVTPYGLPMESFRGPIVFSTLPFAGSMM